MGPSRRGLIRSNQNRFPRAGVRGWRMIAAGAIAAAVASVSFADGTWILPGNGNYSVPTNWSSDPNIPNGIDQTATFGNVAASTVFVTLDTNVTLGKIVIDA